MSGFFIQGFGNKLPYSRGLHERYVRVDFELHMNISKRKIVTALPSPGPSPPSTAMAKKKKKKIHVYKKNN